MRSTLPTSFAWTAVFLLLFAGAAPFVPGVRADIEQDEVNVGPVSMSTNVVSQIKSLNKATLLKTLEADMGNLSAHVENKFSAGYKITGEESTTTVLNKAILYFRKDGAPPLKGAAGTIAVELKEQGNPANQRVFSGNLTLGQLSNGTSRIIRFMVEVYKLGAPNAPTETAAFCDPLGLQSACPSAEPPANVAARSYNYVVDRSRPALDPAFHIPTVATTSTFPHPATNNDRTPLRVKIIDNASDTRLDPDTFKVLLKNGTAAGATETDVTSRFTRAYNGLTREVAYTFALPASWPVWALGEHQVRVEAKDLAKNKMNDTNGQDRMRFFIDKTKPTFDTTKLSTTPNKSVVINGVVTTGFGVNVLVKANASDDLAMDKNGTTNVLAQLFNDTKLLTSPQYGLRYNATAGLWESPNVTIPESWRTSGRFMVRLRVTATDTAGNTDSTQTVGLFDLDPTAPVVQVTPLAPALSVGPYEVIARVTDPGGSLDAAKTFLNIRNNTGNFTNTDGYTKISTREFKRVMTQTSPGVFSASIPDASAGANISYNVSGEDQAGNRVFSVDYFLTVDKAAPLVNEINRQAFRGAPPIPIKFSALDSVSGINPHSGNLSFRTQGTTSYSKAAMTFLDNAMTGVMPTAFDHNVVVEYFAEVRDKAGNLGRNGTATAPNTFRVDRNPPTLTLTGPTMSDTGQFPLGAAAQDDLSGVARITFQARPKPVTGETTWITISDTDANAVTVCLVGDATYQFRAFATDNANNSAAPPATAQLETRVNGAGCPQALLGEITLPTGGSTLDAQKGALTTTIKYSVRSTGSLSSPDLIRVTIEFSPDGTFYAPLASKVANTGQFSWPMLVPSCTQCRLRLTAEAPGVTSLTFLTGVFTVTNGADRVDLDGNGIFDQCELAPGNFPAPAGAPFPLLGTYEGKDDLDGDGLSNAKECDPNIGTHPNVADSDGDGVSDGSEVKSGHKPLDGNDVPSETELRFEQFDATVWIVIGLFVALTVLFAVGITRRW